MQAVQRAGVEFDMCPQCRGIWLDRGELEKLMALEHAEASAKAAPVAPAPSQAPPPYNPGAAHYDAPRRYKDDDDDDDDRHRYGQSGHPKKKRFDLFDIFD
jgi:Zn-finger nucleic acid-binding protein